MALAAVSIAVGFIVYYCSRCLWGVYFWSLFCNAVLNVRSSFVIISLRKRVSCFTLIVSLVRRGWQCSVSLPYGAMSWSVVCDCGISMSYLLAFSSESRLYVLLCSCAHPELFVRGGPTQR